jgi:TolA-binding protein
MPTSTASRKHLSKRELKEDRLVTSPSHAYDFVSQRKTTILVALLAVVALVLVVVLYRNSSRAGASRSEEILYLALSDYDAGRLREAANGLQQFVERYPRHARIGVAESALGNAHLMLGQTNDAKTQFEKAVRDADTGSPAWVAAKTGLGAVASAQGLLDEAAQHFEEAAAKSRSKEAGAEAMSEAIRARIAAGQADAARALLDKAKRDFAGTRAAQTFARYEGELLARGS